MVLLEPYIRLCRKSDYLGMFQFPEPTHSLLQGQGGSDFLTLTHKGAQAGT